MTCYARRERIKQILMREGKASNASLAKRLGVSKNTIANDITALTPVFPVTTIYGRNGGYAYRGNGTVDLNARQTKYLYEYMRNHQAEAADDTFHEILNILKNSLRKDD